MAEMKLSELAGLLGGELTGDGERLVCGLATIETARHAAAVTLVRPRVLIFEDSSPNFCLRSAASFQIPAFEDQDCAAKGHRGIEQGVERVLQNERRTYWLLMGGRVNHIERREIRYQVGRGHDEPAADPVSQRGEPP